MGLRLLLILSVLCQGCWNLSFYDFYVPYEVCSLDIPYSPEWSEDFYLIDEKEGERLAVLYCRDVFDRSNGWKALMRRDFRLRWGKSLDWDDDAVKWKRLGSQSLPYCIIHIANGFDYKHLGHRSRALIRTANYLLLTYKFEQNWGWVYDVFWIESAIRRFYPIFSPAASSKVHTVFAWLPDETDKIAKLLKLQGYAGSAPSVKTLVDGIDCQHLYLGNLERDTECKKENRKISFACIGYSYMEMWNGLFMGVFPKNGKEYFFVSDGEKVRICVVTDYELPFFFLTAGSDTLTVARLIGGTLQIKPLSFDKISIEEIVDRVSQAIIEKKEWTTIDLWELLPERTYSMSIGICSGPKKGLVTLQISYGEFPCSRILYYVVSVADGVVGWPVLLYSGTHYFTPFAITQDYLYLEGVVSGEFRYDCCHFIRIPLQAIPQ